MQTPRGKARQIKYGDPRALQGQAVNSVFQTQPPAQHQQRQRRGRHADIAELDRHRDPFGGITQQESEADEQQQHPDAQNGIAAEQPVFRRREGARREYGHGAGHGRLRTRNGNRRTRNSSRRTRNGNRRTRNGSRRGRNSSRRGRNGSRRGQNGSRRRRHDNRRRRDATCRWLRRRRNGCSARKRARVGGVGSRPIRKGFGRGRFRGCSSRFEWRHCRRGWRALFARDRPRTGGLAIRFRRLGRDFRGAIFALRFQGFDSFRQHSQGLAQMQALPPLCRNTIP